MKRALCHRWLVITIARLGFVAALPLACVAAEAEWEPFADGSLGQITEFQGAGDASIAAYLRKPKGEGPFPAVVIIHGGGQGKEGTYRLGRSTDSLAARYVAEGWAVYSIDFRPNASLEPVEWDDTCRAVETVKRLSFIDPTRVAMIGGSHGGFVTARVAARCDLNCAIPCAPAALDLIEVAKAAQAGYGLNPRLKQMISAMEKQYGAPLTKITKNPTAFGHQSAFTEVSQVRCPLLLINGRNDASSAVVVVEEYARKLRDANKDVETYLPENGPHGFYFGNPRIPESDEVARRSVAFIRKHFHLPPSTDRARASATEAGPRQAAPVSRDVDDLRSSRRGAGANALRLLERLDGNRDGRVAGDEAATPNGRRFVGMFDRDGDGEVTRDEARGGAPPPGGDSRARPNATTSGVATATVSTRGWVDRGAPALATAHTFHSATIQADASYVVYLPPSYESDEARRYPVVFWLHGGRGTQRDCGKFVEVIDAAARAGKCPEMIIVGVNGLGGNNEFPGSQYSDWKDGSLPMESVIVNDLVPHIDQAYRTLGVREGRALEGFSMGGHGALSLAFRHPDLFGVVTAIGPALIMPGDGGNQVQRVYEQGAYKGDRSYWLEHDPLMVVAKNAEWIRGRTFIRLITGEVEGNFTHRRTIELSDSLERLDIEHDFIRPGETGHNFAKVYEAMPTGYDFYVKAFAGAQAAPRGLAAMDASTPHNVANPQPPVCYDLSQPFPNEIGQYAVSRRATHVEPFEIMDGLYYVGNTQVSSHLLTSQNGLILLDTPMPHEVPWLLESIRMLGFNPSDVKVVIGGHAHLDHIGGHWYFQKYFGAKTWLHELDAPRTTTGAWAPGRMVPLDGTIATLSSAFPPFETDRLLHDGEVVEWGGRRIAFRHAPGHTRGTIFIEFPLRGPDGQTYKAGHLGGLGPGDAEFIATCLRLREIDVDVWLGAHPSQNQTLAKAAKLRTGQGGNSFVDPRGWKDFLDRMIARGPEIDRAPPADDP